ncbi:hypothetical protein [Nonomuraea sp. 10N515B]|uniref:hypothetical protein n=1 Tax=Nonomuraea sp. 10N515B TaxID=3457422 RepID=UPI003FCD7C98
MAIIRWLAIGLLCGAIVIPLGWSPRGDGFEHARLTAVMGLVMGQLVTVPTGLLAGIVLSVVERRTRPPGYVLGGITMVFGAVVMTQGWATSEMGR